jgi:hypothetical protein
MAKMMAKKRYYGSDNMAERKRMEAEGAAMIKEDRNAIANLPTEVMFKAYPQEAYSYYNLNDDIKGVDTQVRDDVNKERRKNGMSYPEKY